MENNEELVTEVTENTEEQTVEEVVEPKMYTEEDLNNRINQRIDELLPKKLNRKEAKIRKEYEDKYSRLEAVLKAGMDVESIEEATDQLEKFYENKGIKITQPTNNLTSRQIEVLATDEANNLIDSCTLEELEDEANSLASKGLENMDAGEKIVFNKVANYLESQKSKKELEAAGISEDKVQDKDFIEFAEKLNPKMSLKDKYEMYETYRPKPKVEPIGSMKTTNSNDTGVKEFYTVEEANQFSREDLNKNPKLYEAILNSMSKWK